MLFGSVPSPPNTPRSWTRTQPAAQSTSSRPTAGRSTVCCPLARARPAAASATTTTRLTANPWAAAKVPNPFTQDDRNPGCGVCPMPCTMLARLPGCPARGALPEPASRPRLEQRHPGEEHARAGQHGPAEPPPDPGPVWQRDEPPGHGIQERGPRGTEQPAQPGREDAAERLAEDPHHQAPAHAGQPAEPGPGAAGGGEQPDTDRDLDPDRRSGRTDRVIGPALGGEVHQAADPAR